MNIPDCTLSALRAEWEAIYTSSTSPLPLNSSKPNPHHFTLHSTAPTYNTSQSAQTTMRTASLLYALGLASLAVANPCPFHALQAAAAEGRLSAREAAIVDKMARDPSYIPAMDPEAAALIKRAAKADPEPEANAAPKDASPVKARALLPSTLPVVGGGLRKPLTTPYSTSYILIEHFPASRRRATATQWCPRRPRSPHASTIWPPRDPRY